LRNVAFGDTINRVEGLDFRLVRSGGSHPIFAHPTIPELVNLQEVKGEAKPYQIRQFLRIIEKYNLRLEEEE
jgi:predicted RNA binding protein YcfA (HicA-like mRNA interferase family)